MFSSRIPADRTPNRIAAAVAALNAASRGYVDLTESNPTRAGIEYPDGMIESLAQPGAREHRPLPFGLPEARAAVAADFERRGVLVPADRIVLTASTSEAYGVLFKLLCDPGDRVLVPRPSYPLLEHLTTLEGVGSAPYDLEYDEPWRIDLASLERSWTPRTRAVLVVSPNNPTGSCPTPDEIAALAAFCASHDLALIADEVFADYAWFGAPPPSVLTAGGALTFSLGGLSKSAGLPQLKLGWIAAGGPPALVREALERLEVICDAYLSVAAPVQLALPTLLQRGAIVRERIRARIAGNLRELDRVLVAHPSCRRLAADGGWYAVLRLPPTLDDESTVLDLLERDRVLVHPGFFFDFPTADYVVVSLLPRAEDFAQGIAAVLRRISGKLG